MTYREVIHRVASVAWLLFLLAIGTLQELHRHRAARRRREREWQRWIRDIERRGWTVPR